MTVVRIFACNFYGGAVEELPQAAERVLLTDRTHRIEPDDLRLEMNWWKPRPDKFWRRINAAYWGHHPQLAVPDADVSIMIGNNFRIQVPDLAQRCLDALGDDDLLVLRHPERDCIYEEAEESRKHWRWNGAKQDVREQVRYYRAMGHPEHWGLFHAGMIVRRNTLSVREFDARWWDEYRWFTSQDQLSLPFILRTMPDLKWRVWPGVGEWNAQPYDEGWVRWRDKVGRPREYVAI